MNILSYIGEYFLGIRILSFYEQEKKRCRENIKNQQSLEWLISDLKYYGRIDLFFGKIVPNILSCYGIASFVYSGNPENLYFSAAGEMLRIGYQTKISKSRKKVGNTINWKIDIDKKNRNTEINE